ncbi:MAG TPA: glyceraldehyde 3-phosphate dehydrogenase NAD-binding domain-containing protein, partial [Gaiellaceae bacterium]|nr:glyceraldehyde 3-phosphate dehydrogenase NAD-binding domain-containing protein [Gaiellaceae bacterium]
MATRVAINGFGRVGRAALRAAHERGLELEFVAVNDLAPSDQLEYLLRHDSVYGRFDADVSRSADVLAIDGQELALLHEPDPIRLPWSELDVDVVLDCTGRFRTREDAEKHLF